LPPPEAHAFAFFFPYVETVFRGVLAAFDMILNERLSFGHRVSGL
jgi:hypothetical protein